MLESIKMTKTYLGKSEMTSGNKYRITLTYNGKSVWFLFHDNMWNNSPKTHIIDCFVRDAYDYMNYKNIYEFADEFGYDMEDYSIAKRAYNGCKKQYDRLCKLFTSTEAEILERELEALGF